MIKPGTRYAFDDLRVVGLAVERCYEIEGTLVRVYFRLSNPPPAGWSYLFSNVWQGGQFSLKRFAAVDGDAIWMDCIPEEITPGDLNRLEKAVAQANAEYRAKAQEQSLSAERQAELEARLHAQLAELNRALSPAEPDPSSWPGIRSWLGRLRLRFARARP